MDIYSCGSRPTLMGERAMKRCLKPGGMRPARPVRKAKKEFPIKHGSRFK